MTSLLRTALTRSGVYPLTVSDWSTFFSFNGTTYPVQLNQTLTGNAENIERSFSGYVTQAYKSNGVVFAVMLARLLLFSEARFQFQRLAAGRPGDLFGTSELAVLEHPQPGATTGDLLARAMQDTDIGGNWYGVRRPGRIKRMRPDWVDIIIGSPNPGVELDRDDIDAEVAGYAYWRGGHNSGAEPEFLLPNEVAHFAPIPDPLARFRGMSWLSPVLREIMADGAATSHKLKFFENGATPNLVIRMDPGLTLERFNEWVTKFKGEHEGVINAYKTLYLGGGADATIVGANMREMDFKNTQGAGETRIAAAGGVPPVIVGLSEGLAAATYSNYGQARRRFADMTIRPLWRNFAGSLESIVIPPAGARLWYDDRDIPALAEDQKDLAEIQSSHAQTIKALVDSGFDPATVVAAVMSGDFSRLTHTGLYSVQLQPPMPEGPAPAAAAAASAGRALAALIAPHLKNGSS